MTNKLAGRVAIVIDASAGISEAAVILLVSAGATVALVARRVDLLEDV